MKTIDSALVGEVLREAARCRVLPYFTGEGGRSKADGSVVTQADIASQRFIQESLKARYPDIPLLGEEMSRAEQKAALAESDRVPLWCLDPLDGTSNFAAGLPLFAISLAYLIEGRPEQGWVYDPVRDELFTAARGMGTRLNGRPLSPRKAPPVADAVGVVDFKQLPRAMAVRLVTEMPFRSQRNLGSSTIEWSWLAAGRFHFYVHGGQHIWDLAAGSLILEEAGGIARNFEGTPLQLELTRQSVLATLDPRLEAELQAWLEAAR